MFNYYEFKDGTNITYLELLKPDGTSLGELKNAYNRVSKLSLGEVSELSFTLPNVKEVFFQNYGDRTEEEIIEIENKLNNYPKTNNEDIGKASISVTGYQVKAVYSNGLEVRFVIPNKSISSDMMKVDTNFTCYSLEHELAKQLVIDYRGVLINGEYTLDGLTLEEVSRDLLGGTFWEIDFLDVGYNETDVNPMMRTVDAFNNVSLLAALDSVCATFGAIPEYDTINRKVSFYRADNTEQYKYNGLLIDNSNYMNNIKQTNNADEMITRLYGLGANSLTINGVNPAGVSYIEDLSYFIYPANLNADKTGLTKPSKYMSDDLAYAELIYEDKIANLIPTFNDLQTQKDTKTKELIVLENELTALQTALNIIKDYIDVMFVGMSTAVDTNPDYVAKRTEMDNSQIAVNNKQVEVVTKKEEIANINLQLKQLYEDIKIENNFTTDELKERQNFIYEGLYTNTGINIEQDLYEEMIEFLEKKKEPSISIDVGINSILSMKSKNQTKDALKIKIGEQIDVYYNYKGIDIDIRAQILSITIDEEQNTLDLEIANTQDYKKSSADYLENILKRSITTSTVVDNNVIDWNKGVIALDELDDIYTNGIDAAKIQIDSAAQQSVKINERGITITDTSEPLRFMRATNGVIALTKDGGRTYSTAITPEGVWAERLIGQIILGSQLIIVSDDPTTSLKIQDIPMNTYNDVDYNLNPYGDDFGIVVKSSSNLIFVTRERGFKITTLSGVTLFEATTDGRLIAKKLTVVDGDFSGKLTADIGVISGWELMSNRLRSLNKRVGISSSTSGGDPAFWAGGIDPWENGSWTNNLPFYVTNDGYLRATNAHITGTITATEGKIADYTISGAQLIGNNVGMSGTSGQGYAFWAGSNTSSSAPFRVGHDGSLVATNADISGTITATSGKIGGWTINENSLSGSGRISGGSISGSSISGGTVNGTTITGGSISISGTDGSYFNMSTTTKHPNASGLNVGKGGVSFGSDKGVYINGNAGAIVGASTDESVTITGSAVVAINSGALKFAIPDTNGLQINGKSGLTTNIKVQTETMQTNRLYFQCGILVDVV